MTGKPLSELSKIMTVLPQALVNVTVPNHRKEHFMEYPEIAAAIEELEKEGIHAAVIGRFVEGKAKKILNGGDTDFLERPKTDELYKIYE